MNQADAHHAERELTEGGRRLFARQLTAHGLPPLTRGAVTTLQINVGKLCNQACLHCHVEAGPHRTEIMTDATADRILALLAASPTVAHVDITGGAPELAPPFRRLVATARDLNRAVLVRHNLTVQFEPGLSDLPAFFRDHAVEVVASLPCYSSANVDAQRGKGVFGESVDALRRLNAVGYGRNPALPLTLVYNPVGPSLPPAEAALERDYRARLATDFDVAFTRLVTITNMPIKRFAHQLLRDGAYTAYMQLLLDAFNPATVDALMCRALVSVGWDGALYDCDFNQMLDLPLAAPAPAPRTIWALDRLDQLDPVGALGPLPVATGAHCLGCTAGAGSSCGGALADLP